MAVTRRSVKSLAAVAVCFHLAMRAGAAEAAAVEGAEEANWSNSVQGLDTNPTSKGWLESSDAVTDATKTSQDATRSAWTKMRKASSAALEHVEDSACNFKVSQDMEEAKKALTEQLEMDCASTPWMPLKGGHTKDACQSIVWRSVERMLRELRPKFMEDCLARLHDKHGEAVSGVDTWTKTDKDSLRQRVAPAIQSAIWRERETGSCRGGFVAKLCIDGPALSLVSLLAAGAVVAVCLTLRRRRAPTRRPSLVVDEEAPTSPALLPWREPEEEEEEYWEALKTEELPSAFGMSSA